MRDLSRFSNKMPSPDNTSPAGAPFPHGLIHIQITGRKKERVQEGGRDGGVKKREREI